MSNTDLTDKINKLFESEPANSPKPKVNASRSQNRKTGYSLNRLSQENADMIERAKEIVSEYTENRRRVKDLRIKLNKSLEGIENPYRTLEIALEILEIVLNENVYLAPFKAQITDVRAKHLKDPLAKIYSIENLDNLINNLEKKYKENPNDRALRNGLRSLKNKRKEIENIEIN